MNSISINISFLHPWLLLLMIPALALAFKPYFALPPKSRRMKNRVVTTFLHILVIFILVFIVAGINFQTSKSSAKSDVIILVDRSTSNLVNNDDVNGIVKSILDESPDEYNVGIIEFATDSVYSVRLNDDKDKVYSDFIDGNYTSDQSSTNIDQALSFALDKLDSPENGRIVIVSDGRQTDGNAFATARELANLGTRIDVFYVPPINMDNDALISNIEVPANPIIGVVSDINVHVSSSLVTDATLTLTFKNLSGDTVTKTQNISVGIGETDFKVEYIFPYFGVTEIVAQLTTEKEDAISENNTQYAFVNISNNTSNKVLIVEGVSGDGDAVETILANSSYEVNVTGVDNLPSSLAELIQYKSIILVNVKNSDLTADGFQQYLDTYVKTYGGGLLTIGGERSYQKEDMNGEGVDTTYANLLPIESSVDPKAMAVVIVMDASSSMTNNNSQRFTVAKQAAIASLEALASQKGDTSHQFGVVTFDANLKDVIEITSIENKDTIISQINLLETGYGTKYTEGLQKAIDMLSDPSLTNTQKHIIFLTDGGPQDTEAQYMSVLNSLTDISVSAISLGVEGENDLNSAKVEAMVVEFNGRGAFYRVNAVDQLDDIMLEDTEQAQSGDFVNEVPFVGIINSILPEFSSITDLPQLEGYYGTRAKIGADVVIQTNDGDPLFALWYPENSIGRVGSFTSDLTGQSDSFSESFINDFVGKAFVEGMVRTVIPTGDVQTSDITIAYIKDNYETAIRIRTNMDEGDTVKATITDPNGETSRISLSSISKTTFGGVYTSEVEGLYKLEVVRYNSSGSIISTTNSYSTFSYSDEYKKEYDEEEMIVLMEEIAVNGTYLYSADDMFSAAEETITKDIDLTLIFIIIAMLLFLGNIIVRKFNFKWSHEYFGKS